MFPDYNTSCTFSVGGVKLGTTKVPQTDNGVFLTDLAGQPRNATGVSNQAVLNIAQFLQTMATNSSGQVATILPDTQGAIVLPNPSISAAYFPTAVDLQSLTTAQLTALLKNNAAKALIPSATALSTLQTNLCSTFGIWTGGSIPLGSCGHTPLPSVQRGVACSNSMPTPTPITTTPSKNAVTINVSFSDCAAIGYYVIQPQDIQSVPTAQQIINGQNAGGQPADIVGSAVFVGGAPARGVLITDSANLNQNINYTLYFVGVNAVNSAFSVSLIPQNFTVANGTSTSKLIPLMQTGTPVLATAPAFSDGWNAFTYTIGKPRSYNRNATTLGAEYVTDNVTGLFWQDNLTAASAKTYTWANAAGVCSALNTGGGSIAGKTNWRLPTALELSYLVDYGVPSPGPTINATFANKFTSEYWSSTQVASNPAQFSWTTWFNNGYTAEQSVGTTNLYYVRCVAQ